MIKRDFYINKIIPYIDNELVKVLTGMRRSGKSVLMNQIKDLLLDRGVDDSQIIHYNFEDFSYNSLLSCAKLHEDIMNRLEGVEGKVYFFFDEIQEVKEWERIINSLRVEFDCDIYITGSNAKLLSGELATYLTGRYVEFVVYPFSFKEFCMVNENEGVTTSFLNYLKYGGMPYLINTNYSDEMFSSYMKDLYNSILLKDVVKRNNIRDIDLLERIVHYVTANIGTTFSATNLSKFFKSEGRTVAPETILNYLKACHDAYLFYKVKREDVQGKKILAVNEKYYIVDQGFREVIIGNNTKDINLILENIVYMHLLQSGYSITVGKVGTKEIDFIVLKGNEKFYIQVCYLLATDDVIRREFDVYSDINDHYPKYVLSLDDFDMSKNGIIHMNIKDFLLR